MISFKNNKPYWKWEYKKKRPTKRIEKDNKKILALLFSLFFIFTTIDALFLHNKIEKIEEKQITYKIEIIKLISINYQKEIDIRLAIEQACLYIGADKKGIIEQCEKDLLGIAFVETKEDPFNCQLVGDLNFGGSYGCFQINRYYHQEITQEQAEDPYFASIWTAKRMVNNGYFTNRDRAIRKHNGGETNPQTLIYLNKVNKIAK